MPSSSRTPATRWTAATPSTSWPRRPSSRQVPGRHRPVRRRPADLRRGDHLQGGQGRRRPPGRPGRRSPASAASGHLAVQYAKIFGGTVAAIDVTDEKLKLATELGADIVIDARAEDPAEVLQSHGGADVAIGLAVDDQLVRHRLRRACAAADGSCWSPCPRRARCSIPVFDTVLNGTSVIGSIVGTRADLTDVFGLHAAGPDPGDLRDQAARPASTTPSARCCTARPRRGSSSSPSRPADGRANPETPLPALRWKRSLSLCRGVAGSASPRACRA